MFSQREKRETSVEDYGYLRSDKYFRDIRCDKYFRDVRSKKYFRDIRSDKYFRDVRSEKYFRDIRTTKGQRTIRKRLDWIVTLSLVFTIAGRVPRWRRVHSYQEVCQ